MKNNSLINKTGKLFSLFDNVNLTTKLSGLLAGLVLGYLAIGYAYYTGLEIENELFEIDQKIISFESGVREVELDLQSAKQYENQFYSKKYPIYLSKFDTHMISASQNVTSLIKLIEGEEELGKITTKLGESFEEYRNKFINVAEAMLEIGLDQTQGLHGEARRSINNVETIINKVGNDSLIISMLKMRRHEKNYFSQSKKQYINKAI